MKRMPKRKTFVRLFFLPGLVALVGIVIMVTVTTVLASASSASANKSVNTSEVTPQDTRFVSLTQGTSAASEVPTVLPAQGITINTQFVLRPLTSTQETMVKITADRATEIARTYADAHPFPATTLLSSFTGIGSVPLSQTANEQSRVIQDVPSWTVTFTSDHPQDVVQGKKGSPSHAPKHFNIVINANTGAFVLGFFTD